MTGRLGLGLRFAGLDLLARAHLAVGENGIWQDGGTITEQPDRRWIAFISKFTTQAYRTDNNDHPAS